MSAAQPAVVSPSPEALAAALASLSALERAQREVVLTEGGELARAMRAIELHAPTHPAWVGELWHWALYLSIVRGYRAQTTVATYARTLSAFVPWCIARGADYTDIALKDMDDWVKSLYLERRNSATYRRRHVYALKSFYDWRSTRGYGRKCTDGLRSPTPSRKVPKKYTGQQLRDLFSAVRKQREPLLRQRDELLILLLLSTGLRREEISTLALAQIELNNSIGRIRVEGKGAKERVVPIEGPVVHQLIAWLDARSKIDGIATDVVFVSADRGHRFNGKRMGIRAIENVISRHARRAGLGSWGVHRFRVTFATQLYDDGVDIERIRILLGHESIETTRGYIVVSDRMNGVRLKAHRQHAALGTRPEGLPRWANALESKGMPHA